ncbi:hypothetical protein MHYP_G00034390 [Metynnis hypsauchen]
MVTPTAQTPAMPGQPGVFRASAREQGGTFFGLNYRERQQSCSSKPVPPRRPPNSLWLEMQHTVELRSQIRALLQSFNITAECHGDPTPTTGEPDDYGSHQRR